jgi:hypothetical protein
MLTPLNPLPSFQTPFNGRLEAGERTIRNKGATKQNNTMKHETKVKDIQALITANRAAKRATTQRNAAKAAAERAIDYGVSNAPDVMVAIKASREAMTAKNEAEKAFAGLLRERRTMAQSAVTMAMEIGKQAARLGDSYSGDTGYGASWGDKAWAETSTDRGEQYSRKCTYRKTDASHHVTLDPSGVPCLVENEALRQCSIRDGLHLIALFPDSSCVWVRNKGKAIVSERGWIAGNASVCYHSTESMAHATRGFERKLAIHNRQQLLARQAAKIERRARLITRLCGSAVATIQDAKNLGYCTPGIAAFQSTHGIGDSATLPELVRTGNQSAVALALSVARKMSQKRELATA